MSRQKEDRRVQRTRQIMREALIALMLEKSYEKITIQEIIDRANVGRATFYNHYQDKDDLLLRGVAEIATEHQGTQDINAHSHLGETKAETIRTAGMFRHSQQNDRLHQVMFKRERENLILARVRSFLHDSVEQQLLQLEDDPETSAVPISVMSQFLTGGILSLIHWWQENDFPHSVEEMDEFFQQMAMPGILQVLKDK